jgi:hypothetical protein
MGERQVSRRWRLAPPVLPILAALISCSGEADPAELARTRTVEADAPVDSVFELHGSTVLNEHPDHVIGDQTGAAIDNEGRLFLTDVMMREFKAFDRSGEFLQVLGRLGEGPGEYLAPVSVAISRAGDVIALADMPGKRVLLYDAATLELRETVPVSAPVALRTLLVGGGDTLIVAGQSLDYYSSDVPYQAVRITTGDSLQRPFLPIPANLRRRALGGSILHVLGDQTDGYLYLVINGSPTLYRYDYAGDLADTLRLSPDVYAGADLPDVGEVASDIKGIQEYVRTQSWLTDVVAVGDSRIVLELASYDPAAEDWVNRLIFVSWRDHPRAWRTEPCACELLANRGDTVALLADGPPDPYRVEWRTLRDALDP